MPSFEANGEESNRLEEVSPAQVALLFGGGANYGMQSVGVLEELLRQWGKSQCTPDKYVVAGSSAGAFLAAVFALNEEKKLFKDKQSLQKVTDIFHFQVSNRELLKSSKLEGVLKDCLGAETTFNDCISDRDLNVVVSDLDNKKPILLSRQNFQGRIWEAVKASAAISGLYKPQFLRKKADGFYEFVDENYHQKYSNAVAVGDGSFTADIALTDIMEAYPDVTLPIAVRVLPGSNLIDSLHPTIVDSAIKVLKMTRDSHGKMQKVLFANSFQNVLRNLGHSVPVSFLRGVSTLYSGTQFTTPDQEAKLVKVIPKLPNSIPLLGQLSAMQLDALLEAGKTAAVQAEQKYGIIKRIQKIQVAV